MSKEFDDLAEDLLRIGIWRQNEGRGWPCRDGCNRCDVMFDEFEQRATSGDASVWMHKPTRSRICATRNRHNIATLVLPATAIFDSWAMVEAEVAS